MQCSHDEAKKDAQMILSLREDSIDMNLAAAYIALEAELSATKEKLAAAEKRIRESQEQKPYGYLHSVLGRMPDFHYRKKSHGDMIPVYTMPPIPPKG